MDLKQSKPGLGDPFSSSIVFIHVWILHVFRAVMFKIAQASQYCKHLHASNKSFYYLAIKHF